MFRFFKKKVKKKNKSLSLTDYNIFFENKIVDGVPVELLDIGDLNVTTSEIVVCDPLTNPDAKPLLKKVNKGKYPIKIYVAKTENSGDRYAIAKLEFTNKKAIKWELALRKGEDVTELNDKEDFFGFPVDAGLGSFMDYRTAKEYDRFLDDFMTNYPDGNIYDDLFANEFKKNAVNIDDPNDYGNWINYKLPNSEFNVAMFASGYGDGIYPAYWGIDENNEITSLVIDFLVLLVPEE